MDEVEAVLPAGPWALAAVATVLVVALSVPPGGPRPARLRAGPSPVAGRLGAALALLLAVAVVLVARLGPASELLNPVPALVVGLGWPLLLLLPGLVGLVGGGPDTDRGAPRPEHEPAADVAPPPEDPTTAGTAPAPEDPTAADAAPAPAVVERGDVRPAVLAALAVLAFLTVPTPSTTTTAVAAAVAVYAVVVTAGCVAFGRRTVAARFEVLGLLARWGSLGRALPRWAAPRGALAVVAVVLGGAWFERYERTAAWTSDLPDRGTTVVGLVTALVLAAAGAALLHLATRRGGAPGTAAAVLLPLALGAAVGGVVRRALISIQLLADQAAGPRAVDPDPFGVVAGQAVALALVVLGAALAAAVLARRMGEETARLPGVGVLLLLTGASAWLVLQP